jgi:16S rRNA (guanine966-N2)-methyltransferase
MCPMRITGGQSRNRSLTAPTGDRVRPASDKVRAAVFNILMHRFDGLLEGAEVLDLFCGSGAYGLEALSRGAARCVFVDAHPASIAAARANATQLGYAGQAQFLLADARRLPALPAAPTLVFLDPPYATTLLTETLPPLLPRLTEGAVVVCEAPATLALPVPPETTLVLERIYGASKIIVMTRETPSQ